MTHRRARSLMPLAAGNDLAPGKAMRFERHLASCKICHAEFAVYRESLSLAKSKASLEKTPDWKEAEWRGVMKAVLAQEQASRPAAAPRIRGWAWAAASAVLVALIAGGFYIFKKTPQIPVIARLSPSGDVVLPEPVPLPLSAPSPDLTGRTAAPSNAQPVMAMTFVSQETGLTIHWVFNESFDYKEDKK